MLKIIDNENLINIIDWSNYVSKHKFGNIFNTPEYFQVHKVSEETEPRILFATDNGVIKGILTYYIHKENKFLLNKLTSRALIFGSPLFDSDNFTLKSLLKNYLTSHKKNAIYSQIRNIYETDEYKSVYEDSGFIYEDHLDLLFDLKKGEELLWEEIHKFRKKEIRNSYKKGIKVKIINENETNYLLKAYDILSKLYKEINLPLYSKKFFDKAIKIMSPKGYLKIFGAFLDDELIGIRYVLCYKKMIYDWYAGSNIKYLKYRPNDLLPWEVMKWGANNGFEIFDFGGAGKPSIPYGVRDYKLRFGGTLVNYGRYKKINKKIYYKIGEIGIKYYNLLKR